MKNIIITCCLIVSTVFLHAGILVEAENFDKKGGWVIDQQFMDAMGSPYLMAHGLGTPVADATTNVPVSESGIYHIYVRTFNWTSPWHNGEGPGRFALKINGKKISDKLGVEGNAWMWQYAGKAAIKQGANQLSLQDLTGFNGRCDAIYLTLQQSDVPPADMVELEAFRKKTLNLPTPELHGDYDLVVVGGGVAGICAAVSASRLGCRVALINDRPILGGNNSSEIRVHLGGRIEAGKYKQLGNLLKEFGPEREGNARPAEYYEDEKKLDIVQNEKNIDLFLNHRAVAVSMDGERIASVTTKDIETGRELIFQGKCFSDCTGDGTIGYLAGADYLMGREGWDEYGEALAPEKGDKMTMGASVQWYSNKEDKKVYFPKFSYGVRFTQENCEKTPMGEWHWETGMNLNQVTEFERIRDYGLLVVFSNWSFLKNELKDNQQFDDLRLAWTAYVAGKRESRRLLGDYLLKQDDLEKHVFHEDGSFATTWTIDLHYPDPENSKHFPGQEFKSEARHKSIYPYSVPYRCLYSRNVSNLFMAGRNISVTHVALGTVRVMRTTAMMGEVVGMAASLCKKHDASPRDVYRYHLNDLKGLMEEGTGKKDLPNNQQYNLGDSRTEPPVVK